MTLGDECLGNFLLCSKLPQNLVSESNNYFACAFEMRWQRRKGHSSALQDGFTEDRSIYFQRQPSHVFQPLWNHLGGLGNSGIAPGWAGIENPLP